ncbi:MAG: hypothetical protein J3K34DRAFT_378299 [Monoraphidium minutum]|nr:MAG: hypothetical protein J3K34DRAFT_378299 [Monoraphidium minutum]
MQHPIGASPRPGTTPWTTRRAASQTMPPCAAVKAPVLHKLVPAKPRLTFVGVALAADGAPKATWRDRFPGGRPPPPRISVSDAEFRDLGVEFVTVRQGIRVHELNELFDKVGFPRRDPERLKVALENTHRLVWVRAVKAGRAARIGQILGFARATSDGVFSATIWDVAVAPQWQRSGLGRAMMERLTLGLVEDGIPAINLYAEPQVVDLYKKLGFKEDTVGEAQRLGVVPRKAPEKLQLPPQQHAPPQAPPQQHQHQQQQPVQQPVQHPVQQPGPTRLAAAIAVAAAVASRR